MNKRITLVACFDNSSNEKIKKALDVFKNENFCKVPLHIENRLINDTLPYHITLSAWNKEETTIFFHNCNNLSLKI